MKTALQLMEKRNLMKILMEDKLRKDEIDVIWQESIDRLSSIIDKYGRLPKGVQSHTNSIFPAAAVYLTLKEKYGQEIAYTIIEDYVISSCISAHMILSKILKFPGMPGLFVKLWDPITRIKFSSRCGFKNVFYPKNKGEYRMDVISCPYNNYFTELGCPELTKIFCESDNRIYGVLTGVIFERAGTIGMGAKRCDFYIRKNNL